MGDVSILRLHPRKTYCKLCGTLEESNISLWSKYNAMHLEWFCSTWLSGEVNRFVIG